MKKPEFFVAIYGIIEDDGWKILFQKRKNTWFADGTYQVPSGHLEWRETIKSGIQRELLEEIWIEVKEDDLEIVHVGHKLSTEKVYIDFYLKVLNFSWEIKNMEPDKCEKLEFIDIDNIPEDKVIGFNLWVLKDIREGKIFSEVELDKRWKMKD